MNNFTKKIAAICTAMTMAVSMLTVCASASKSYNLHYSKGAPTSSNVIEKWMYGIVANNNGCLKINSTSFRCNGGIACVNFNVYSHGNDSHHSIWHKTFDVRDKKIYTWSANAFRKGFKYDVVADLEWDNKVTYVSATGSIY